jgi:serine protease
VPAARLDSIAAARSRQKRRSMATSWALVLGRARPIACALVALACGGEGGGEDDAEPAAAAAPLPAIFDLSGSIGVEAGSVVDGDVNDPAADVTANDTLASAQELANPVTLGGYVNAPGEGAPGRSQLAGDPLDYFRVSIAAGQPIRLSIAEDGAQNDLDLALLDLAGAPLAVRDGTARSAEIIAPQTGVFVVEVSAVSGASNYLLSIGEALGATAAAEPAYVPGQLIVRFDDGDTGASALDPEVRAATLGLRHLRGRAGRAALLSLGDERERGQAYARGGIAHLLPDRPEDLAHTTSSRIRRDTRRLAKALRRAAGVRQVSLDYLRQAHAVPTDQHYPLQWHYPQIGLPAAWDDLLASATRASPPIRVAVVDTGIASGHPDLLGRSVDGYDFIQDPAVAGDGDGCDADAEDAGDAVDPADRSFHGTHVAGTVAARTSLGFGGDASGVAGVAFDARIMPLRALGAGGGSDFDIMQAVAYAAGLDNDCGVLPTRRADVINMSLGGPGNNPVFQDLIHEVRLAGVTVVASAGNEGLSAPTYPASHDGVISVAALDAAGARASYSNYGNRVDLAAPGGDLSVDLTGDGLPDGVLSTWVDPDSDAFVYAFAQGTSMSAPHVAGVIALMLDVNPSLNPFDIDALLVAGALSVPMPGAQVGHGRVDAAAAVAAASATVGGSPPVDAPRLDVDAQTLNFGFLVDTLVLTVRNGGGNDRPLVVSAVTAETDDPASWLSVTPAVVDAHGLGTYDVSVDRDAVPADGIYTGRVHFDSSENDLDVSVILQVGEVSAGAPDLGHHWVLLVDSSSMSVVAAVRASAVAGVYAYRFDSMDPGSYLVVAGSDYDNDFTICDEGEACGTWPTRGDPQPIELIADTAGIDFTTGFAGSFVPAALGAGAAGFPR